MKHCFVRANFSASICSHTLGLFLKKEKWANHGLFYHLFFAFQTNIITIFTTNICEKCPFSVQCRDLNTQPSEQESPSITTRPGRPPWDSFPLFLSFQQLTVNMFSNFFANVLNLNRGSLA